MKYVKFPCLTFSSIVNSIHGSREYPYISCDSIHYIMFSYVCINQIIFFSCSIPSSTVANQFYSILPILGIKPMEFWKKYHFRFACGVEYISRHGAPITYRVGNWRYCSIAAPITSEFLLIDECGVVNHPTLCIHRLSVFVFRLRWSYAMSPSIQYFELWHLVLVSMLHFVGNLSREVRCSMDFFWLSSDSWWLSLHIRRNVKYINWGEEVTICYQIGSTSIISPDITINNQSCLNIPKKQLIQWVCKSLHTPAACWGSCVFFAVHQPLQAKFPNIPLKVCDQLCITYS